MRLQQQAQLRRHAAARAGARALRRQGESELGRFAAVARDDVGLFTFRFPKASSEP